jgi:hypothetical protein
VAVNLFERHGSKIGAFPSAAEAKLAVPQVTDWVQNQERLAGWNGWEADAAPFSDPDYRIELA